MNFFEQIIYALQRNVEKQQSFGWYHIMCVILTIALTLFLCIKFKNATTKQNKIIILILWLIIILFEIYKQLVYSFSYVNGVAQWKYQWYIFPFQLCSTPLYVLPLILLIKNEKVKEALYSFITCFALFGGLCVIVFPNDVFDTRMLGIIIQTMVHHGIMVALGCYLFVYNRNKLNIKYYLKGLIVFTISLAIAFTLNEVIYLVTPETFNMFYISRHYGSSLILLEKIFPVVPYWLFIIIYFVGFALIGLLLFGIAFGLQKFAGYLGKKYNKTVVVGGVETPANNLSQTEIKSSTNTEENETGKPHE